MTQEPFYIETPRLLLRRYREGDLEDLHQYLSDPEVVRFEPYRPMDVEETRAELQRRINSDEMIAVELKETGTLIGNVYLGRREFQSMELGYVFNQRYWGMGLAAEACRAVLEQTFAQGTHRVYAECDPENESSWRLLEALGFEREGFLRQNVFFWADEDGSPIWKDTYIYGKLNESDITAKTENRKEVVRMNFARVTPESVGIPSGAVLDMLDQLYREGIEMHAFKLLRHGKVCAEGSWAPYSAGTQHILFSFSKSFTSTAIGFAVQEGLLSLDDRLIDIFPDKAPENPSENLQKCRVRHLLMMGCGHESEIQWANGGDMDWITQFLHHPFVYEPGTHFMYNTAGTNMLCAILKKKTGLSLTEFLKPRLFEPLGMGEIRCVTMPDGTELGGAGLSVNIEEMARFVQFVANKGSWEGKQLLNSQWFDMATAKQIENAGAGWGGDPDWQAGYGFQFWRCAPEGVFRGDGAYGQYGVVMTRQDAVLVIQAATVKLQAVLTAVWEKLLPQMQDAPLPEDQRAQHMLAKRLERLELNPMLSVHNPGAEASLDGAVYIPDKPLPCLRDIVGGPGCFGPEGGSMESITFKFNGTKAHLVCKEDRGEYALDLGMEGHYATTMVHGVPFGANSTWWAHDTLCVHLVNTRMVMGKRFLLKFNGSRLQVTGTPTLPEPMSLGDLKLSELNFGLAEGEVNTKTRMYWEVNE